MRDGRLTALGEPVLEAKLLLAVATVSSDEGRKVPTPILLAPPFSLPPPLLLPSTLGRAAAWGSEEFPSRRCLADKCEKLQEENQKARLALHKEMMREARKVSCLPCY